MKKKAQPAKCRMIHIRLDEKMHRRLKTRAAQLGTTIQQTVEDLIHLNLIKSPRKSMK